MLLELLTVAGGIAYAGISANKAEEMSLKAQLKREKAVEYENDAYRRMQRSEEKAENSIKKLFNIKKGIYATTVHNMRTIFEPISTLSFLGSIHSLVQEEKIKIDPSLSEMEYMENVYSQPMTKKQETLAICFGITGIMHAEKKNQEQELAYASKQMKMARLVASHYDNKVLVLDTIAKKNEMMWELLKNLNLLLAKSLKESSSSIQLHGNNEKLYTDNEIDNLRFTIQLTDMICKICESSLVNQDGEFNEEITSLIKKGNDVLSEANTNISTRRM